MNASAAKNIRRKSQWLVFKRIQQSKWGASCNYVQINQLLN